MTVLFDASTNILAIYHNFLDSLSQKPKLLKSNTCKVTSASDTDSEPIGQYYLTFKLGNNYFTGKFIVIHDLSRD